MSDNMEVNERVDVEEKMENVEDKMKKIEEGIGVKIERKMKENKVNVMGESDEMIKVLKNIVENEWK